eukprot:TRINITY_DN168_c0_g1_i1.p2 TRINITY_DN168_c0_g1~~TRINITY_DN168_c0_g1_i1.p2  ORF type:complete len:244 (-),score=-44.78 TRINITY_DN168_c0_g1_i1:96-827(-)
MRMFSLSDRLLSMSASDDAHAARSAASSGRSPTHIVITMRSTAWRMCSRRRTAPLRSASRAKESSMRPMAQSRTGAKAAEAARMPPERFVRSARQSAPYGAELMLCPSALKILRKPRGRGRLAKTAPFLISASCASARSVTRISGVSKIQRVKILPYLCRAFLTSSSKAEKPPLVRESREYMCPKMGSPGGAGGRFCHVVRRWRSPRKSSTVVVAIIARTAGTSGSCGGSCKSIGLRAPSFWY